MTPLRTPPMGRLGLALLACFWAVLCGVPARADFVPGPIPTLFNTGVDNSNVVLPDGSADPHYTLVSAPDGSGGVTPIGTGGIVVNSSGFPAGGPWLANSTTSKWLSITADQTGGANPSSTSSANLSPVPYKYTLTFDLTGFSPTTQLASISGQWASDNKAQMFLNGVKVASIGIAPTFNVYHPFAFDSTTNTFISGLNTLEFDVINLYPPAPYDPIIANPTGLRVEISGVVTNIPTPEPASLALAGSGVLGLGAFGLRRRFWARG